MTIKPLTVRKGLSVCFNLDYDAEQLLRAMAPHSKGLGRLVSELVRKEAERRAERPKLLETLAAMQSETSRG